MEDYEVYNRVRWDHRWAMNKLMLSEKLGYLCGPAGMPVPKPGYYMVRPVMNLYGMGAGSAIMYLHTGFNVPPGYFWQEVFYGRHLSIDYEWGRQCLAVEGVKRNGRFHRWCKVEDEIPAPLEVMPFIPMYRRFNIEYIGGKIIECHFRGNPDFEGHNHDCLEVVWEGDPGPVDIESYENCDGHISKPRKGFRICK
jgi:hypothetical protein